MQEMTSPLNQLVLKPPFNVSGGFCYSLDVRKTLGAGNVSGWGPLSRVFIYEDGKLLGPAHTIVDDIQKNGSGRFCHWRGDLYFSSSDNSDPNANGRNYKAAISDDMFFDPIVSKCMYQFDCLIKTIGITSADLKGKNILEIGSGSTCGLGLISAGLGARTVCVEKRSFGWSRNFHPGFIDLLCRRAADKYTGFDPAPLHACQAANNFVPSVVDFIQAAMEDFSSSEQFDITYSAAVIEHTCDPQAVLRNLYRATKNGGYGCHTIDFRDHRNFEAPWEFLLLDDADYEAQTSKTYRYYFGNRVLDRAYEHMWREVGFTLREHGVNLLVDEKYLQDFIPRLRRSSTRFQNTAAEDLRTLGSWFIVER